MARLEWAPSTKTFGSGVDRVVLYSGARAVPWNGIVSIEKQNTGSTNAEYYFDGVRSLVVEEVGEYEATVKAITYPEEFEKSDGFTVDAQERFGLCYRTESSGDYKLNLVYQAMAVPDPPSYTTVQSNLTPSEFSWQFYALNQAIPKARPSAHLILDSNGYLGVIEEIEDLLYGTDSTQPRLPSPAEIINLVTAKSSLRVTNNGDGTATIEGPASMVQLGSGVLNVSAPNLGLVGDTAVIRSY